MLYTIPMNSVRGEQITITLQPITSDNWVECIQLAPTAEQQRIGFVEPNRGSLAQAYAIYADETMVGFVMYGRWPEMGIRSSPLV